MICTSVLHCSLCSSVLASCYLTANPLQNWQQGQSVLKATRVRQECKLYYLYSLLVSTEKLARALTAAGAMYTKPIAMAHQSHGTKGILIHVQRKPQKVQFWFSTLKCPGRVGDTPGHGSLEPREWRLLSRGRLNGGKARAHACSWHAWHFESQG